MSAASQIVCPSCGALNRMPLDRPAAAARCGACHLALFSAHPAEVDETGFERHLRSNDIPLLLESKIPVDAVVVASAPAHVQRARVMARPGMSEEKFARLLARQMSDAQKRQQAHFVVMTDKGLDHAREQVKMILADIRAKISA